MLESKDMSEKEKRSYLNYDRDLIFKYKIRLIIENYAIKEYKKQLLSGQTKNATFFKYAETSSDKRKELFELQFAERNYIKEKGHKKKKYEINRLAFRHEDFQDEAYLKSLIKMAEALLHVYGTDRSSTLTLLLTHLGQWILEGTDIIKKHEIEWNNA